jgi:osmoprotectant transport system ATP-binding protein
MIRFEGVDLEYPGGKLALRDVSVEVGRGELLVLLGASGSGKSTATKLINRLLEPSRGRVLVDGSDVAGQSPIELRRRIGYVFQAFGLFPHMTLGENVGVVPGLLGWNEGEIARRSDELLELLGLSPTEYRNRYPAQLSGGEQQRVGLARALAARPQILLMDEPFGALDPLTRDRLQVELQRIHRELGLTTVLVTHDVTEAILLADRIVVLDAGRVIQVGEPRRLAEQPDSDLVRDLMATPERQLRRLSGWSGAPPGHRDGPSRR